MSQQEAQSAEALREELLRARLAGRRRRGGSAAPTGAARGAAIPRADRSAPLPLSLGQQQMWFLSRLEPDSTEYLVPLVLRLRGALDTAALQRAFDQVCARHEILRTRYAYVDGSPAQVVDEPAPVPLARVDLTAAPAAEREERALDELRAAMGVPFDLATQWPVRGTLVRLAEEDHVLAVVFHHIACDAWSTRIFGRDLSAGYAAALAGTDTGLAAPALQYADFAAWQRAELAGPGAEPHLAYWRERLAGIAPLDLPADRPRPAHRSHAGADVALDLPPALSERVREAAKRYATTPFAVFLTAYQALVSRYTGRRDIPVGTVVSGRTRPELQELFGYGINTLVMRARWDDEDATFAGLLEVCRKDVLDAFDHQEVPFARLVDELQPERDQSRTPLYQVAFTMHEWRLDAFTLPGLTAEPFGDSDGIAKCDLTLQVQERPDGTFHTRFQYVTALFDHATVERLAGHFAALLDRALAEPDAPVAALDILGDEERALVLPAAERSSEVTALAHELFEARAAEQPEAVAVTAGAVSLSYAELNARANRIAHLLRDQGIGAEDLVGVHLQRGADLIPSLLGVLKSGAGYLPLDPANPMDRLGYVLADAGARVVLTTADLAEGLRGVYGGQVVILDAAETVAALAAQPVENPVPVSGPDNLIYTIYTSGSTGKPKGVALTHTNVVRLMSTAQDHYGFGTTDVWSMAHSYAFDVSVFEMWGALAFGGHLVVVPQDVTRSPDEFIDLLVEQRVSVLSQTPTAFRALVTAAAEGDARIGELALRAVVFAGEKLEVAALKPWTDRVGVDRVALVNMYGITETTVHTTYHRLDDHDLAHPAMSRVGHPLADLAVYLLDGQGNPAPIGVPGEIHVAGPGVARGYLNRPALTAERFVPDPFSDIPGARMYRSGDVARRLLDGSLEVVGRIDDQVKIRGFRIELGEITAALSAHSSVREAVTVVREDTPGDKRLVAYVIPAEGHTLDPRALREELGQILPEYMVPAAFVELDAIPLTTNGKLDKRALPAPDGGQLRTAGEFTAPRTPLESHLAEIWQHVLGVDRVGVHDSFFELGGDSLRAVALVGALREAGYEVAVRDVFDRRTVARLAELTGEARAEAVADHRVAPFELISDEDRALLPEDIVDAYPLGQNQLGMVIEMLADDSQNNYHNVSSFWVRDAAPFSAEAFAEAGRRITARHEILRTSIDLSGYSRPLQLVHDRAEMTMGVHELTGLDADAARAEVAAFGEGERANAFDMARPGLMRFHAHTTSHGGWWISVTECHPIMEGWSYHSLLMEVVTTYLALRDGREPEVEETPDVRFADAVAAELKALDSAEDRAFWADLVGSHAKLTHPEGWGDPAADQHASYKAGFNWRELEPGLRALAAATDTSMKAVMLAMHLKVMSQLTAETSFHTGLVCDTRPEVLGADRVYGMYLNTLPFPYTRTATTWGELVREVFDAEVRMWPHRGYPLPAVQREWGGTGRLMDVYFNYQDFRQLDTDLVDALSGMDDSPTEFPLTVSSRAGHVILTANLRSVSRENADRLAGMYRAVLESMAHEGASGDARAAYLPAGEREAVLPAAERTSEVTALTHELFEARAAEQPEAVAVTAGAVSLSYAELNARANRIAHLLRAQGVGAEDLVGVHLDRGPDLIPAILGVLKSGAGYLPLDPANPMDRLGYVLADAGARVVLTTADLAENLREVYDGQVLVLDAEETTAALAGRPQTNPVPVSGPDNLIYTIYTSGSTGKPKGVALTHTNVVRLMSTAQDHYGFGTTDVWSMAHSYAFDVSVFEMWGALAHGGHLVVVPKDVTRSPDEFIDLLADHGVTVLSQTPTAFRSLVTAAAGGDLRLGRLALRAVIFAGEKLEVAQLKPWTDRVGLDRVALVNMYGITETTVHTTYHRLDAYDLAHPATSRVGHPLADLAVYLLDAHGHPVPLGIPGEIHVAGPGVARGYLNRPALTAERFVPDPFSDIPGARMYRSGDVARRLPDGSLEVVGRIDDQVKIRGFRIELGEITAALSAHSSVREAVTVVREDTPGDKRLVAYVIPAEGHTLDPRALREELGATLPEYMVPAAFVELDAIPLTTNGKLDKRALPAPSTELVDKDRYIAPRTPEEERMAAVWAEALGVERVGVEDDFFQLGGDSIRAVGLVGKLRSAGFEVGVRDVFEHTTVAALCASATGRPVPSGPVAAVEPFALISDADRALLPDGLDDAYPLTQVQTGMLVETLASGERGNYHDFISFLVRDDGPFDIAVFREAVGIVGARHDILRTSADLTGFSVPMQLVHHEVAVPVDWADLRGLDRAAQQAELVAFAAAERANPFDLSERKPLLRIFVHVQSDETWRVSYTKNHAVLEGWSYHELLKELTSVYRDLRAGREIGYEAPPVRFADTVAAELAALESAEDRAFWERVVTDNARFELPAGWHGDLAAPAERVDAGFSYRDLESGLRRLAAAAGVPVKAVLHGAHLKVMSQITDAESFFTGLVGHTRPEVAGSDRLMGMYITTLPHPFRRTAATWGELVRQVFDDEVAAWPHRHFPLPSIQPGGQQHLIDVFFTYLDFRALIEDEVVDEGNGINRTETEFGLAVSSIGGMLGLRSDSHVLSQENADRLAGMYRAVLESMARDGASGDARATYLPGGEREVLLPAAERTSEVTALAHELFEARAAERPEAPAVTAGTDVLTYGELNARANRIAHLLRAQGVGAEDLVGVHLHRGPDLIPAILGVLKSGAGYLPLDPANPLDRLGYVLADARARTVLTTADLAENLREVYDGHLIVLDTAEALAELAAQPVENPALVSGPDNLIYTIYTSGSTGKPKGVALTHTNVVRLMSTAQDHYGFSATDVWSMAHSYAFDVSVFEMWGTLAFGGHLIVVPQDVTRSPDEFIDLLADHGVTVLSQTPTAFRSLVTAAAEDDPRLAHLALRTVIFAGEKLEVAALKPWTDRVGVDQVALVNMYGITETTVHTTYHRLDDHDLAHPARSRVGHPLADLAVYLLDSAGHPVPLGVPGEIHVAGPGVARGYLNRPALTAERFVPDPFSGVPGARMYRSGDVALRRADGGLEVVGRIDDQVKIRGFRIELGEITAALSAHETVREAVTVVREDTPGDKRLIAYVVPAPGKALDPRALRDALGATLPEYMVPAAFVELDAIPLTTNGKLDKRALPAPDTSALTAVGGLAPRNPLEQQLVVIWSDVLGLETVGVEDSFFDLGGDSIRAVSLVGAVRAAGYDVSVRDVFEQRSIAGLAELIGTRGAPAAAHRAVRPFELIGEADRALLPAGLDDAYPLTQVQTGMLYELQAGAGAHYHSTAGYKVRDDRPFDAEALRAAVREVTARHEALRTSFDLSTCSTPLQLVHTSVEVPLTVRDLRGLSRDEVDAALREHVAAEQARPLDPATAPQLRMAAHLGDDGWWLSLTRSHMVTEGWSQHTTLMELIDCYRALREGRTPAAHQAPDVRFADTVAAELAALDSAEDRAYWQGVVDAHAPFALPAPWADASAGTPEAVSVTVPLGDLEEPLRALAASARVSVKSVLLAAHLKVLSSLTHEERFHAGLVCDTRPEVLGADRVHGMYLNTLPFPYSRTAATWGELLRQVFDTEVALWQHRRFPLPEVHRLAGASERLIDVIFNYQDFHNLDAEQIDLAAGFGSGSTEFGLTVTTSGGGLTLKTHTGVVSRADAERLAGMYRQVLEAMAGEGVDGSAELVPLPTGEADQLARWGTGAPATGGDLPTPALIAEQAARTPQAVAVTGDGFHLTYAELDTRANQIAHHLTAQGITTGSLVGVLLDRGPDLHATLLGVWKAGAAYIPIDPDFPAARIHAMLGDAQATTVLTTTGYADRIPAGVRVIDLAGDREQITTRPDTAPDVAADPDDLAYVIYTSGSTGRPKGVAVTHRGLANHLTWARDRLTTAGTGGGAVFSSIAFDLVVPNVWAPLLAGQRVHLLPQDLDLSELGKHLLEHAPFSFLKLTPGHLEVLSHQLTDAQARELAGVVVVAGEALPGALAAHWAQLLGAERLINEYGPTEASVGTSIHPVPADPGPGVVPIGAPLPGLTMHILDARMHPVPLGTIGELYVGGTGVARGYLHRPDLTAERFLPDPETPGARLYRTGDLARWSTHGTVEFLGRTDHQVKIRGYRIETGDIETTLLTHPGVTDARVVAHEDADGGKRLVAYVVTGEGTDTAGLAEELERHCAAGLPAYMVPSAYVALAAIPLNANGKLDRAALPAPDGAGAAGPGYTAPVTAAETDVVEVWQRALGADRVGTRDRFFDRGGDSIRAVAVVGGLRGRGYDVSVRDVFEQRTPAALAALVEGRRRLTDGEAAATAPYALIGAADRALLPADAVDAYPLGQVQLGMVAELLGSADGGNSYHTVTAKRIKDDAPFDEEALRAAVREVTARHDALRTSVHVTGYSVPLQVVHRAPEIPVVVRDCRGVGQVEGERLLHAHIDAERADLFDLKTAPLLRVSVHLESDDAWWLTLTTSHVVTDGWSKHTLEMELVNSYREIRDTGAPAPYQAPPVRYADAVAGELESLAGTADGAYWKRVVSEYAKMLPPAAWAGAPGAAPERYGVDVPVADLAEALRARAAEADVPFKTLMLAAHLKVLSQLTDEPAFHTGVVFHTRPEATGAEGVVGMHLNTLPFPYERGARTWRELLARVFAHETEVWAHRRYPLPTIQRAAGGERLVDVFFNYVDFHQTDASLVDTGTGVSQAATEFGLTVDAYGDRKLGIRADSATLARPGADRLAGMYRAVLESIAAGLDGDATAVLQAARTEAAAERPAPADTARGALAHELFETRAAERPEAPAVTAGDAELSYGELNARANRIAHLLRAQGVGAEDLVGVHLHRGADLIPALLGVLKSGAGYLPLDPANPLDRLGYVLGDARARTVLTTADLAENLREVYDGHLVVLDTAEAVAELDAQPVDNPAPVSGPDNLIYTIYTSGSTGRPKGVALTHTNVVRLMSTAQEHYEFDETDVWSMAHSYAFDVSVFEMWGALAHGGRLVVVPQDVTRSPDEFIDLLVEQEVSVLSQTPTAFRSLVTAAAEKDPRVKYLFLRAVIFAGEKLEIAELKPWTERIGLNRVALVNMYGITETTVHTTYHRLTKRDFAPDAGNPIGDPLSDLTVHLLDADGRPVPDGVPGEIHVAGPGVARGYLNRPALTAERFVPDPFSDVPGARMYRSGDLALRRADGTLDFHGRIDDQVKIRGFRIELGEITAALSAHSSVREAVTVVREDTPGDKRLIAYAVPAPGTTLDPRALREELGKSLPEYMVPTAFVELDAIPLTTNGKLDKRALPAPDGGHLRTAGEFTAPRTPLESHLAEIWQNVLGVDRVGVHDSFFELGGDSIRAVILTGTLRDAGYDVGVKELMERPTVAELGELAAERGAGDRAAPVAVRPFALIGAQDRALLPEGVEDAYPLTQNQLGMQIEMLSADGRPAYHIVTSLRVRDGRPFDAAAFQRAVDALVARHDVLRTSVDLDRYSVPLQLVHTDAALPVRVTDLALTPLEEADHALRGYADELSRYALDQYAAPLLRIAVHTLNDGSWQLTTANSHVILDGWSINGLLAEVMETYHAYLDGTEPARTAPAVRFADTVAAELAALDSPDDRAFWQGRVTDAERFGVPAALADHDGRDGSGTYALDVAFDDIEQGLRDLAARARTPFKSVLLAAHLKVLSSLTHEDRFLSGLTHHVRPEAVGADQVRGMFLNVLPVRYERSAGTWGELVTRVFAEERAVWAHRHFPMPALQREFTDGARLIEVYFSYQDFDAEHAEGAGALVDDSAAFGSSSNEFGLSVSTARGRLKLRCAPRTVSRAHAERLAGMYRQVLEAMAGEGVDGSADLVPLPSGEAERLARWGTGAPATGGDRPTPALIAEQAARTPQAVAVTGDGFHLTYAELDTRANQIAHHLAAQGITTGSLVGVLLDRGPDLHATLLGVWKAGAAYIPIDPDFPAARIHAMLGDAQATAALTTSGYADRLPSGVHVIDLAGEAARIAAQPSQAPGSTPDPDDLAYVIYTSGSTGRPKGVAVTHRGLANHLTWARDRLTTAGTGGGAVFSSIAFDLVVPNVWAPLLAGQRVLLLPQDLDLSELGERLVAAGPFSFLKLTPGHLDILSGQLSPTQAAELAGVVVVAGEALPGALAAHWAQLLGAERLINEYGPTEASVGTSIHPVPADPGPGVVPIGAPLPGLTMRVLDQRMHPVPVGTIGELYVGGTGVARGYLNRPDLTAERFLPDPDTPGARLYRTGDLARWSTHGAVEFLGRTDHQVKIRGYRIETGDIETTLLTHPGVREAVVLGHEHAPGDTRLAAYVVAPAGTAAPTPAELAAHCGRDLPEYMVPAAFTVLDALPLNANGKVDRRALPDPSQAVAEAEFTAPVTETEIRLAAVWERVLGVERVGRHDSFFARGGHSILVIKVVAAAQQEKLPLSLFMLYQHETLAGLAAAVDAAVAAERAAERERAAAEAAEKARAANPRGGGRLGGTLAVPDADEVRRAMERCRVPGVGLALLHGGELVAVEAYGAAADGVPLTAATPFQTGSLSKHVTALGVLRLADDGVLDLDADVNTYLTSWRVPGGAGEEPVTLRQLLGHRSGLSSTPGGGHHPAAAAPALLDLLRGTADPDVPPVTRGAVPGSAFRKANAHYVVVQQVLEDATGEPFAALMRRLVLDPLSMRDSSFAQDFPDHAGRPVALGHDAEGRVLDGGWRVRPDAAAAGLWSTAADLAKVALEVRRSALGRPLALLRRETAAQLLAPAPDSLYGLGTVVDVTGSDTEFGHGGTPTGYHGVSLTALRSGTGLVVLTNADAGEQVVKAVAAAAQTD
ncbi:amino acid adenylation domain-containing protein [Streptomyces longispororuber]|uniref:amino acid adenylation domain-containing protein n=1 Tax=Streptomyces longispororuber TaxID=68230 RepID=UPI0037011FF0